jgi:hypothetical protein
VGEQITVKTKNVECMKGQNHEEDEEEEEEGCNLHVSGRKYKVSYGRSCFERWRL